MTFMDLLKANGRVKREELWQVLRMYDVDGKLLNARASLGIQVDEVATMFP